MHVVIVTDRSDFQNRAVALWMGFAVASILEPIQSLTRSFEEELAAVTCSMMKMRHCQVERKYVHRFKVADHRSVIFGPQERASRPMTPTWYFL